MFINLDIHKRLELEVSRWFYLTWYAKIQKEIDACILVLCWPIVYIPHGSVCYYTLPKFENAFGLILAFQVLANYKLCPWEL